MRWLFFICCSVLSCFGSISSHAAEANGDTSEVRTWKARFGNFSVDASYVSQADGNVTLRKATGDEVTVPIQRLSQDDVLWLELRLFDADDRQSVELCEVPAGELLKRSATSFGTFVAIHNQLSSSPIPGLYAAVSAAAIENEPRKARAILAEVERRIEAQRENFPERHHETLVSVLNNQAVCEIKENRGSTAAVLLLKALELESASAHGVLIHNARLLSEKAAETGSRLAINSAKLSELRLKSANVSSRHEIDALPPFFFYLTDSTAPAAETQTSSAGATEPSELPLPTSLKGLELLSSGSGFVIAPNWVMTNRHVAEKTTRTQALAVWNEGHSPSVTSGKPLLASEVILASPGGPDLALLRVDGLNVPPVPFCLSQPTEGSDLLICGYPDPQRFGASLTVSGGLLNKIHPVTRELWTDAKIDSGNSGGPIFGLDGSAVGVATARSLGNGTIDSLLTDEKRGIGVFGLEARKWLAATAPQISLAQPGPPGQHLSKQEIVERYRSSIFCVLVYGDTPRGPAPSAGRAPTASPEPASRLQPPTGILPELWCSRCNGVGFLDCRNSRCNRGAVTAKKKVVVGRAMVAPGKTGPVYGEEVVRLKCTVCSGKGGADCPDCERGLLRGQ
ncbi:trypsin-like peptidase domain-containing protein [Candidatus Laterigemmans baculatus]|uniref:trypsin-like peptidase domain-containing protein n=1 Tax=Candidatus Laterigemmans baculatus TaxID=2770505 RepID=UPI0013D96B12|nr:trypsin-like peptidase domain-containing protein [Candidatus Laterigemmans baculatus]